MEDRLNLGREVRELKLGTTFTNPNAGTSFHTLKYDFKPASVDPSKMAILNVGSNNQVTVTVPHLDSSGVPKTVFKGNQKNYTKECVLIVDKNTGQVTLERLHHNIQVKKTRTESTNKNVPPPVVPKIVTENLTQRTSSKTKVSTGVRKNAITGFVPKNSPHQGSPSYPHHKSPQSAPAWNANNGQSTLPSIPIIGLDDDLVPPVTNQPSQASQIASVGASMPIVATEAVSDFGSSSTSTTNLATGSSGNSVAEPDLLSSSDTSSDSESSGSDSDSDSTQSSRGQDNTPSNHMENGVIPTHLISLSRDLCLSESNSDSDDD
ncbi:ell-associated factor Eaf [Lutzomyia longipalpis]|uniref:ell-associated factor Eaf n=1 Tax=Lutzomyia longipalpis TaxID=7200 RepID=UPI002483DE6A|nr:ell-associated factor Eaf [Lutzomyia longipalpis]